MLPSVEEQLVPGETFDLEVSALGTDPLSYQWSFQGEAIPSATNAVLTLNSVSDVDAGSYTVTITNEFGAVTSVSAPVTVSDLLIDVQPVGGSALGGESVTFTVEAVGVAPIFYQWNKNRAPIDGATGNSLTLNNITTSEYTFDNKQNKK